MTRDDWIFLLLFRAWQVSCVAQIAAFAYWLLHYLRISP